MGFKSDARVTIQIQFTYAPGDSGNNPFSLLSRAGDLERFIGAGLEELGFDEGIVTGVRLAPPAVEFRMRPNSSEKKSAKRR
jgi:hypothetical protein